ncbi:MFS domain-containing histidine kinase [Bacillus sp. Cr_A10]|uniref:sensor histidine kinase n=1 Tax=Bacillus sp. Cr_A10 TaxID=3033993 RepID=UPI0023DC949C|nr:MFS domain-containing histidine kinase [Bacillus sp. Cr_A10]MDF2064888.1 MFS domain-containing histidine kinase [Bacillus sp. Cr_A10]
MKHPIMKNIIISILAVIMICGLFTVVDEGQNYIGKNYFDSDSFQVELESFQSSLVPLVLAVPDKEDVMKNITVTRDEIEEYRYRYGGLQEQLDSIRFQYEGRTDEESIEERNKKMEDITKNFEDNAYVEKKILIEKEEKIEEYFRTIEREKNNFLNTMDDYIYDLKNIETGERFTNGEVNSKNAFTKLYSSKNGYLKENVVFENGETSWDVTNLIGNKFARFEGTVAISEASILSGSREDEYKYFIVNQRIFYGVLVVGVLAAIAFVLLWKRNRENFRYEKAEQKYNKYPIDVRLALFFISIYVAILSAREIIQYVLYYKGYDLIILAPIIAITFTACTLYQWTWLRAGIGHVNWKQSLIFSWGRSLEGFFLNRTIAVQTLIMLIVIFFWGFGTMMLFPVPEAILIWVPATILIGIPVLVFLLSRMSYLNRIIVKTEEMAKGVLRGELEVKGKSPVAHHAANLNQLRDRIKSSHSEQAKSERLKTELITNVSHDLRTPLTSIITYTDLLKNPSITDEERASYIAILDKKSMRLKTLIEDLFEVSKMATGNIELVKQKVDLTQLLQQAIAEHQEEIDKSELDYRVAIGTKPIMSNVDGQKWWRILDNLIINTLKYALPNTRVYINLDQVDGEAVFVIKNIAKYELGNEVSELTERFKRADTSRHTDGSGLGLAIAQSIVDLHGGSLRMEVDGDLFKVTVTIAAI